MHGGGRKREGINEDKKETMSTIEDRKKVRKLRSENGKNKEENEDTLQERGNLDTGKAGGGMVKGECTERLESSDQLKIKKKKGERKKKKRRKRIEEDKEGQNIRRNEKTIKEKLD